MRLKLMLALTAGIAPCSSALAGDDQNKPVENIPTIQSDARSVEIRGLSSSNAPFESSAGSTIFEEWFIRTFLDARTRVVVQHQLYAYVSYSGDYWRDFRTASTDNGQPLSVVPINQHFGACTPDYCRHSEALAVVFPEALLRDRAQSGLQVKISARLGNQVGLWVSPEMIQKQLTVLAQAEKLPQQAP